MALNEKRDTQRKLESQEGCPTAACLQKLLWRPKAKPSGSQPSPPRAALRDRPKRHTVEETDGPC
jgi:hypothetical protein